MALRVGKAIDNDDLESLRGFFRAEELDHRQQFELVMQGLRQERESMVRFLLGAGIKPNVRRDPNGRRLDAEAAGYASSAAEKAILAIIQEQCAAHDAECARRMDRVWPFYREFMTRLRALGRQQAEDTSAVLPYLSSALRDETERLLRIGAEAARRSKGGSIQVSVDADGNVEFVDLSGGSNCLAVTIDARGDPQVTKLDQTQAG